MSSNSPVRWGCSAAHWSFSNGPTPVASFKRMTIKKGPYQICSTMSRALKRKRAAGIVSGRAYLAGAMP